MPPLRLLVFVVGAGSLGAEIAAVRLLAPFFGASTIVWANTIGVVLVALSIGYWLGGRFAHPPPGPPGPLPVGPSRGGAGACCWVVLGGGLLLAVGPLWPGRFFDFSVEALDEVEAGAFVGSLA